MRQKQEAKPGTQRRRFGISVGQHDAIFFKSHSSIVCTGLIGIPMQDISLRKL
jgi:hypothetical protein